jgi:hypothetical protein
VCPYCIVDHHVLGRKHDPYFIERICEYHHALIHDQTTDDEIDFQFEENPVRREVEILKVEAIYHRQQADLHRDWAAANERRAEALLKYLESDTAK